MLSIVVRSSQVVGVSASRVDSRWVMLAKSAGRAADGCWLKQLAYRAAAYLEMHLAYITVLFNSLLASDALLSPDRDPAPATPASRSPLPSASTNG